MAEPRYVRVPVCNVDQYTAEWPTINAPTPLADVIGWFNQQIESIPAGCRAMAYCEIKSGSGYDDFHSASIGIYYLRPETADEIAAREMASAAQKAKRERQAEGRKAGRLKSEIRRLRELQAKYPG